MSVKRIVIEASVALKCRLRDDGDTAQADQLLDDHINGTIDLLVPSLFDYEVKWIGDYDINAIPEIPKAKGE